MLFWSSQDPYLQNSVTKNKTRAARRGPVVLRQLADQIYSCWNSNGQTRGAKPKWRTCLHFRVWPWNDLDLGISRSRSLWGNIKDTSMFEDWEWRWGMKTSNSHFHTNISVTLTFQGHQGHSNLHVQKRFTQYFLHTKFEVPAVNSPWERSKIVQNIPNFNTSRPTCDLDLLARSS